MVDVAPTLETSTDFKQIDSLDTSREKLDEILQNYFEDYIFISLKTTQNFMESSLKPLNYVLRGNEIIELAPKKKYNILEQHFSLQFEEILKIYKNMINNNKIIKNPSTYNINLEKSDEIELRKIAREKIINPYRSWLKYFIENVSIEDAKEISIENPRCEPYKYCFNQLADMKKAPETTFFVDSTQIIKKYLQELIDFDISLNPNHKVPEPQNITSQIKHDTYNFFEKIGLTIKNLKQNHQHKVIATSLSIAMAASGGDMHNNNSSLITNNPNRHHKKSELSYLNPHHQIKIESITDIVLNYNNMNHLQLFKTSSSLKIDEEQIYTKVDEQRESGIKVKYSSKLVDYSKNDLREMIVQIHAFSASNKDTISEIKQKLNLEMSTSSLYREINKYKKEKGFMHEVDGNMVLNRTNKHKLSEYLLDNYPENMTDFSNKNTSTNYKINVA